ncbi:DNA-binding protein [Streptomyces gamaensis]|uniref:DNA-binding protein n=1 Tax=Streptomyces gamaensis TaxID=1763542 RepID=A0ABW0YZV5_9ACTN
MKAYTYPEAAEQLRVPERWLRRNISRLPHKKKGRVVTFSAEDLSAIDAMHHVQPITAIPSTGAVASLRPLPLRPSSGRRARTA